VRGFLIGYSHPENDGFSFWLDAGYEKAELVRVPLLEREAK
jgi:hypothetical protein